MSERPDEHRSRFTPSADRIGQVDRGRGEADTEGETEFVGASRLWGDGVPETVGQSERAEDASSYASPATLTPFRYPMFAAVWFTNTVSNFGGQIQGVGAAWLMTSMTRDPQTVSLVTGATLVPILLFSLASGAIADSFDRRRVLLVAQSMMFLASALLAWLAPEHVTPTILIALTFVIGCGFALNAPAWQAAVRELVPVEQVPAAISLNIIGFNLSRTAGPAVGGLIVAVGGAKLSFAVNAISYVGLLMVLGAWLRRTHARPVEQRRGSLLTAIREGVSHGLNSAELRHMLVGVTLFGIALGALLALLPLVVREIGTGPAGLGLVFGCSGGGGVLGAIFATELRRRCGHDKLLRMATVLTALAMAGVALSPWLWLTAASEALTGFAMTLVYTSFNILAQALAPRRLLGRILSIHQMAVFGGLAAGTWLWGAVAKVTDVRFAIMLAALTMGVLSGFRLARPPTSAP